MLFRSGGGSRHPRDGFGQVFRRGTRASPGWAREGSGRSFPPDEGCGAPPVPCAGRRRWFRGAPAQPGPVSGNQSVCNGAVEAYTTTGSIGATSYNWTTPAGSLILNTPPYTNSILVQWGATGGNVTAAAVNDCGTSPVRNLSVAVTCRQSQVSETTGASASLYPNPTSGKTSVKFDAVNAAKYVISVVDVTGRVIISDEVSASEGINMHELDLTNVAKGIYLVRMESAGKQTQLLKVTVE